MSGYTIFLGPFAGIMVTDVCILCGDSSDFRLNITPSVLASPQRQGGCAFDVRPKWPIQIHRGFRLFQIFFDMFVEH